MKTLYTRWKICYYCHFVLLTMVAIVYYCLCVCYASCGHYGYQWLLSLLQFSSDTNVASTSEVHAFTTLLLVIIDMENMSLGWPSVAYAYQNSSNHPVLEMYGFDRHIVQIMHSKFEWLGYPWPKTVTDFLNITHCPSLSLKTVRWICSKESVIALMPQHHKL